MKQHNNNKAIEADGYFLGYYFVEENNATIEWLQVEESLGNVDVVLALPPKIDIGRKLIKL